MTFTTSVIEVMNSIRYVLRQSVENEPEARLYHILSMDEGSSSESPVDSNDHTTEVQKEGTSSNTS